MIASLPGSAPCWGAEFLAATGGELACFGTPDRLAAFAGLAPAPWDSGRIRGKRHRPRRYHRRLQHVFCYFALVSIGSCLESRRFYDRKRAEGKRHTQAVLALARRRVNVLWVLLRDQRPYRPAPPAADAARPAHQPSHRRLDTCIGKLPVAIAGGSWRPEWCA